MPRDWFRVKLETNQISVKSAAELRKHYTDIAPDDFVILLDHIDNSRFIKGNETRDLNIVVSKFIALEPYDKAKDEVEIMGVIEQISDFTGLSKE